MDRSRLSIRSKDRRIVQKSEFIYGKYHDKSQLSQEKNQLLHVFRIFYHSNMHP